MADVRSIDCETGEETVRPVTAAEQTSIDKMRAEVADVAAQAEQRSRRRQQAIERLNTIGAGPSGVPAADVRYVAKILAKVLPLLDLDPGDIR